jgi:hypothetical protein
MCSESLFAWGKGEQHELDLVLVRERLAEDAPVRNGTFGDQISEDGGWHVHNLMEGRHLGMSAVLGADQPASSGSIG